MCILVGGRMESLDPVSLRGCLVPMVLASAALRCASEILVRACPFGGGACAVGRDEAESLILAQNERWRRA